MSSRWAALGVVPLLREPLDVALPLGHQFAEQAHVSPADVIGEDWIGVPRDYPIDRVLNAMSAGTGVPARVVHRTTHLPLAENLVAAGHGVALLPRLTSLGRSAGRFRLEPLTDVRAGRRIEDMLRPDGAAGPGGRTRRPDQAAGPGGRTRRPGGRCGLS